MKYFIIGGVIVLAGVAAIYFLLWRPLQTPQAPGQELGLREEERRGAAAAPPSRLVEGVEVADLKIGDGAQARPGQTLTVNYVGTLASGAKFDSSYDRGEPFTFALGKGMVISGWERGIPGMRVGGRRRLKIPPELGYGAAGAGTAIPPNATLVFDVEMLGVK